MGNVASSTADDLSPAECQRAPRRPDFDALHAVLLQHGVAPFYARRTLAELADHYDDLECDALSAGLAPAEAADVARAQLGGIDAIAAAILSHRELLDFDHRWPRVAGCLKSAAVVGTLPGVPVVFCIDHNREIARWGSAIGSASLLMGSLMAWLNWLITP
jgi:hypothetical protein